MKKYALFLVLLLAGYRAQSQNPYFPPLNNNAFWDTLSPQSQGWCTDKIDSLYQFLEQENSKAFLVLKDGRMVLEKYFGSFTKDSVWYWASAGKTLTSFLVGKAREDGILALADSTSRFLGQGWTSEPPEKERKITIRHQLTMTSGLDDGVPDNHCTLDTCLRYLTDAGTRWAYHNAPYTLLEKVLEAASGQNINTYTQQKLKNQTGITGAWLSPDYDNVFYSKPRSMARFGILVQNQCKWNGTPLLGDTAYIRQMTNTSQLLNLSYGYLWWLNGKSSFRVPGSQLVFPGSFAPDAPADMFAAIGKNGQILSIVPSQGLVVVRMGNASNSIEVPFLLCNQIWQRLNKVICPATRVGAEQMGIPALQLFPNPVQQQLKIILSPSFQTSKTRICIRDFTGKEVLRAQWPAGEKEAVLNTGLWKPGFYILTWQSGHKSGNVKICKE